MLEWLLKNLIVGHALDSTIRNMGKPFADDLIVTLKKAHLGKLPPGQYAEQRVSAKTFSRDELRIPLDAETLRRMDACTVVHQHDVQLRTVSSKMNWHSKVNVSISISVFFEGEMENGERVSVSIGHALLVAYIERDAVRGMALRTLKEVKSP